MKASKRLIKHGQNAQLFDAIEASILANLTGTTLHMHAEGLRGTGKTTIIRSAKQILPNITRIKNCLYNCDPLEPHCPNHRNLSREEIMAIGTEEIPMPFMEISHSAKIGTVVGSIDLAKLTGNDPSACLLPGLVAQAHRGILFIDEINRLADTSPELADVLLDVMGTKPGRIQIEEVGIPKVEMPVRVCVWAASNPDEEPGPLAGIRRQLSDRFDLVIPIKRPTDVESVTSILIQSGGDQFSDPWTCTDFASQAQCFSDIAVSGEIARLIAGIYVDFNIESLRAMEALLLASRLTAARHGQTQVQLADIRHNLVLTLGHRVEQGILDEIGRFLNERQRQDQMVSTPLQSVAPQAPASPLSGLEDHTRPISGPAIHSDEYRQTVMPISNMLTQLLQKFRGTRSTDFMSTPLSSAPGTPGKHEHRTGSGLTGGHQTGVGPGVMPPTTELSPVAPADVARPIELLSYTEIIKGPEEIKP